MTTQLANPVPALDTTIDDGRVVAQTHDGAIRGARERMLAELNRNNDGLEWWLPTMREYLYPPTAGRTTCLLARSGHMKTTTLLYGMRRWAEKLAEINARTGEMNVGLFAWAEQSNERAAWELMRNRAFTWKEIRERNVSRKQIIDLCETQKRLPLVLLGYSDNRERYGSVPLVRQRNGIMQRINAQALGTEHIALACEQISAGDYLADGKGLAKVAFIGADYLQAFRPEARSKNRFEEIAETAREFTRIAQNYQAPFVFSANANLKQIDDGEIPGDSEVYGSSEAVMNADDILAGVRPIKKYGIAMPVYSAGGVTGESYKLGKKYLVITHDLVVWRINKARESFNAEGQTFGVWFSRDGDASENNPYQSKVEL